MLRHVAATKTAGTRTTATAAISSRSSKERIFSSSSISPYLHPIPLPSSITSPNSMTFSKPITDLATHILDSLKSNTQIPRLRTTFPSLTLNQHTAYLAAASILQQRTSHYGERPVGRKIGFTNRNIWPEYNIDRSNWSYVYDKSVVDLTSSLPASTTPPKIDLTAFSNLEPRIEPELILGIDPSRPPTPSTIISPSQLLTCVSWLAPGFEIVVSPFKDWIFTSSETTAAFALHGRLLIGPRVPVADLLRESGGPDELLRRLETFKVELFKNGDLADTGVGANVLGSPVKALGHLVELLASDEVNPALHGGEVVTTGTLTRALGIGRGEEKWRMKVSGLGKGVDGVECIFKY